MTTALSTITFGMNGAAGRMGTRIIQLAKDDPVLQLGAAIDRAGHPAIGQDVGSHGVVLASHLERPVDVMIDFSTPEATMVILASCLQERIPLVVGTTGLTPQQRHELDSAADVIPLLIASNFSKAVNLLFRLVGIAAKAIGTDADIEIVERHHHFKKDAPSGTALTLAQVAAEAIGTDRFVHGRSGLVGERPRGEIGLHSLRTGDNPGEHTVVFGLMGECLELSHRALNRDGFARGALDAARFLAGKPPGLYSMEDLLGGG